MALTFQTATTDRIDHGNGSSIDNIHEGDFTVMAWVYRTANGENQVIISQSENDAVPGWHFFADTGPSQGAIRFIVRRATARSQYTTSAGRVPLNTWAFVAGQYDWNGVDHMNLYYGSLTAQIIEEASYSVSDDGSGAELTATGEVMVGNHQYTGDNLAFIGDIAHVHVCNTLLSLGEIQAQQYRPHVRADSVLFCNYYSTGHLQDLSGNGNNGTNAGASNADHVPLGPPFGFDLGIPYAVAAAGVLPWWYYQQQQTYLAG